MKMSKLFYVVAFAMLGLMACHKDAPVPDMSGNWVGNWGFNTEVPSYYEKWVFDKSGDMVSYDATGFYATGTWTLQGDKVEVVYVPLLQNYGYTFKGTYDENKDIIEGTWGETPSSTDGGKFEMGRE